MRIGRISKNCDPPEVFIFLVTLNLTSTLGQLLLFLWEWDDRINVGASSEKKCRGNTRRCWRNLSYTWWSVHD